MLIVDAHLDLAYNVTRGRDPRKPAAEQPMANGEIATVGLPDLHGGGVGLICATIFCFPANSPDDIGYRTADEARAQALPQLAWYRMCLDQGLMRWVRNSQELPQEVGAADALTTIGNSLRPGARPAEAALPTSANGPAQSARAAAEALPQSEKSQHGTRATPEDSPSFRDISPHRTPAMDRAEPREADPPTSPPLPAILLMEGADVMRSPADVGEWFDEGLRIVGLSWRKNRLAGGTGSPGPITAEGRELVREMDRFGIIHDASHLAEESFWQLLDLTAGAVIASHSNCRALVDGDRHLSDEMIRALIARGSVIGINFFDQFLVSPQVLKHRRATLADVVTHIRHICDLAGNANHVALGTDMDGGLGREQIPAEIQTSADLPQVAKSLAACGFVNEDIHKIMGANWIDFFKTALPQSTSS